MDKISGKLQLPRSPALSLVESLGPAVMEASITDFHLVQVT